MSGAQPIGWKQIEISCYIRQARPILLGAETTQVDAFASESWRPRRPSEEYDDDDFVVLNENKKNGQPDG